MSCVFFFKQKTEYEMLRRLVGSEMCIRDSHSAEAEKIALEAYGIGSTEKKITKYIYQIIQ